MENKQWMQSIKNSIWWTKQIELPGIVIY